MSKKKEQEQEPQVKEPIDMNTDEALDYVFAPEIVRELKREAGLCDPVDPDSENE